LKWKARFCEKLEYVTLFLKAFFNHKYYFPTQFQTGSDYESQQDGALGFSLQEKKKIWIKLEGMYKTLDRDGLSDVIS